MKQLSERMEILDLWLNYSHNYGVGTPASICDWPFCAGTLFLHLWSFLKEPLRLRTCNSFMFLQKIKEWD